MKHWLVGSFEILQRNSVMNPRNLVIKEERAPSYSFTSAAAVISHGLSSCPSNILTELGEILRNMYQWMFKASCLKAIKIFLNIFWVKSNWL